MFTGFIKLLLEYYKPVIALYHIFTAVMCFCILLQFIVHYCNKHVLRWWGLIKGIFIIPHLKIPFGSETFQFMNICYKRTVLEYRGTTTYSTHERLLNFNLVSHPTNSIRLFASNKFFAEFRFYNNF